MHKRNLLHLQIEHLYRQSGNDKGDKVTFESGGNTNIIGSQVIGNRVVANVGTSGAGNLTIKSLQDTNQYQDKQTNIGGSISAGAGRVGGSVNFSNSNTDSNFASVNEQAGFFAGAEGFEVNVAGNTSLTGAVIASSEQAVIDKKNSFVTQTLTLANIENSAAYEAQGSSFSAGAGLNKQADGSYKPSPTASAGSANLSDDSNSVTVSGISGGAVTITNDSAQTALTGNDTNTTIALLNRDVQSQFSTNTTTSLGANGNSKRRVCKSPIFAH